MNYIRAKYIDFCLFWNIKVPAFITRIAASLPSDRDVQDGALYAVAYAAFVLLFFGGYFA